MDMCKVNPNVNIRIIGLLGMSLLFLMVDILWTKMKSFLLEVSPLDGALWEKKHLGRWVFQIWGQFSVFKGLPSGSDSEESTYSAGDLGSIPGSETSSGEWIPINDLL